MNWRWRTGLLVGFVAILSACSPQKADSEAIGPTTATRQPTTKVVVQPGQSLDAIAHAFRVPKRDIIALNQLVPPYQLKSRRHPGAPGRGRTKSGGATEAAAKACLANRYGGAVANGEGCAATKR
jgi:hypothetical protein